MPTQLICALTEATDVNKALGWRDALLAGSGASFYFVVREEPGLG